MTTSNSEAFAYPPEPLVRRHGPGGYHDYASYRPWLRDEFAFRCVYCLIRECWGRRTGEFDLDHFVPQCLDPNAETVYNNLLYACHGCNVRKGSASVPDPTSVLTADSVRLYPDGTIVGLTDEAHRIIRVLCLNSPASRRWRRTWIRIIELAKEHDPDCYRELMRYPDDMPDLANLQPPENPKPDGVSNSHFARRKRGEIPETYAF